MTTHPEAALIPVSADWAKTAYVDEATYNEMYKRSVENPEVFWAEKRESRSGRTFFGAE